MQYNGKTKLRTLNLALLLLLFILSPLAISSPLVITYRAPESNKDKRFDYDNALLKMALDKTTDEYGEYQLVASKPMNFVRAMSVVKQNSLPNFFIKLSYYDTISPQISYVPFPVDLGIVGYRVCFISPLGKERLARASHIDVVAELVHGQGQGWLDVEILRHNNFKVIEVSGYERLFSMVATNRFDLFCRGVNELLEEFDAHKEIKNLDYDTNIAFTYPLPRLFYTHQSNKLAIERITKGLLIAYHDGSLVKLWLKNYETSISFSQLENRKIYHLENPLLKNINFDFQQYFYQPKINVEWEREDSAYHHWMNYLDVE